MKNILLSCLLVGSLTACDLAGVARQTQEVTIGDALVRAQGLHEDRREWDDEAQDLRKGFVDNCKRGATAASATAQTAEDWERAAAIYDVCMQWHQDNKPKPLVGELLPELKALYKELTDEQIEAFGLPPRGNLQ